MDVRRVQSEPCGDGRVRRRARHRHRHRRHVRVDDERDHDGHQHRVRVLQRQLHSRAARLRGVGGRRHREHHHHPHRRPVHRLRRASRRRVPGGGRGRDGQERRAGARGARAVRDGAPGRVRARRRGHDGRQHRLPVDRHHDLHVSVRADPAGRDGLLLCLRAHAVPAAVPRRRPDARPRRLWCRRAPRAVRAQGRQPAPRGRRAARVACGRRRRDGGGGEGRRGLRRREWAMVPGHVNTGARAERGCCSCFAGSCATARFATRADEM
mmetsp:Transcript_15763/g.54753  ORF Transcript_15763/g.54753 Transcript_15763/m.54753 type:complete len:268 (-) Transcript_15763:3626-4429(-)